MTKYKYTCRIDGTIEVDTDKLSDYDIDPFHREKREFDVATYLNRICNRIAENHSYWTSTGFGVSKIERYIQTEEGEKTEELSHMTGGCGGC